MATNGGERMLSTIRAAGSLALFVLSGGCATVIQNAGFGDVSAAVEERDAIKIVWNSGTDLDQQAREKIDSLLKGELAVDQAVQIALLNNRELQAVYSDLGVAQADLVQAGLLKNPIFDAAVLFPASGGRADLEISAVMNFLDVFYMPLRTRVAAARLEEAKLRVTGAVLDFAARVRSAFHTHQANEQMIELRRSIVEGLAVSYGVAQRLHDAGNITDLDLARERAFLEGAKLQLGAAEIAARESRERLNILMGVWGNDTAWRIEARMPDIPKQPVQAAGIEQLALSRSIDLSQAGQRILVVGEELGISKATALVPDSHLGSVGEREEGSWEAGPAFELPIPLFDRGQGRIGRGVAELRRAQQEHYALAVRVRSTARTVRDRVQASRDRALYYRDILLPLRERIVNEAQLHYNAMQLGVFQLLRAREQQIEAGVAYVEALRDYWLARTDRGQLLSGRLPDPNGQPTGATNGRMKSDEREGH
jgi:outer membrane protein, heavy metal efflux system